MNAFGQRQRNLRPAPSPTGGRPPPDRLLCASDRSGSYTRVSVVTSGLRPLDTITHGPCVDPIGRDPAVGCVGPSALLLSLDIPAGEVELPEGGTGFADAVRIQLVADGSSDYDVLSQRATIAVDPTSDVLIPRFGGAVGEELTFDLGGGKVGTCTLTGDLPLGS